MQTVISCTVQKGDFVAKETVQGCQTAEFTSKDWYLQTSRDGLYLYCFTFQIMGWDRFWEVDNICLSKTHLSTRFNNHLMIIFSRESELGRKLCLFETIFLTFWINHNNNLTSRFASTDRVRWGEVRWENKLPEFIQTMFSLTLRTQKAPLRRTALGISFWHLWNLEQA